MAKQGTPKGQKCHTGWAMVSLVGALVVELEVKVGLVKLKPLNLLGETKREGKITIQPGELSRNHPPPRWRNLSRPV